MKKNAEKKREKKKGLDIMKVKGAKIEQKCLRRGGGGGGGGGEGFNEGTKKEKINERGGREEGEGLGNKAIKEKKKKRKKKEEKKEKEKKRKKKNRRRKKKGKKKGLDIVKVRGAKIEQKWLREEGGDPLWAP